MTESLYDLLGVEPSASESEIKSAWRSLVTVLGPTDHRFGSINDAASVLLDADKRAAYDATLVEATPQPRLAPDVPGPVEEPAAPEAVALDPQDDQHATHEAPAHPGASSADASAAQETPGRRSPLPSFVEFVAAPRVVAVAAIVAIALIVATAISYLLHDDGSKVVDRTTTISLTDTNLKPIKQLVATRETADVTAAVQAAVAAAPKLLAYDYRTLAKNEADAKSVMTTDYATTKFVPYFEGIVQANAPRLKQTVVLGPVVDAGVVMTNRDLVEVLLYIDRYASNASAAGVIQEFVTLTMVNQNGIWLVSSVGTAPIAK